MRKLNLSAGIDFQNGKYTVLHMLREFVFSQDWSQDEGTAGAFERITKACIGEAAAGDLEERDFTSLCTRLKQVQFPAAVSIELGQLRNDLVLKTPKLEDA